MASNRHSTTLIRTITVFIGMLVLGVGMLISAQFVASSFVEQVLIQNGSAIFGAALTFFLIQMFWWAEGEQPPPAAADTTRWLNRTIATFVILAIAGEGEIVFARYVNDPYGQSVLQHLGAAIFGAGLAFFLVRMFRWAAQREQQVEQGGRPAAAH
jgi:hypothetical protein